MPHNNKDPIKTGNRVVTPNNCRGKVIRIGKDELGPYIIVKLDRPAKEFAYDPWELRKIE